MTPEQHHEHHHADAGHHHVAMEKPHADTKMLIMVLLALNLLLGIYIAFFKHDALRLETMKVGGAENMKMAEQLYSSPVYIQQQKSTLDQILGSMNQAALPTAADTTAPTAPTVDTTAPTAPTVDTTAPTAAQ